MVEDHHEPIISKEDFETVGALMAQRAQEKNIQRGDPRYQNRYPFSVKVYLVGRMREELKRHVNSQIGYYRYAVWVCLLRILTICCMRSTKSVREADLEGAFTTMLNKLIRC